MNTNQDFVENKYMTKRIGDSYLITTDHRSWTYISEREYQLLKNRKFTEDESFFATLKEKGIILSEKNVDAVVQAYRKRYQTLRSGVGLHVVIPSIKSDALHKLKAEKNATLATMQEAMDKPTADKVIECIMQSPSEELLIEFRGGEPLDNVEVIKHIILCAKKESIVKNKKVRFRIISPFKELDKENLKFLIEQDVELWTLLDGPKELHEINRSLLSHTHSFDHVVAWIEHIQKEYGYSVHALPTITKYSLEHANGIVETYKKLGLQSIYLDFIKQGLYDPQIQEAISYKPEEFLTFWKKVLSSCLETTKTGTPMKERYSLYLLQNIFNCPDLLGINPPFHIGITQLTYLPNGDIYPLDESRFFELFKLGNVNTYSYKKITTSKEACSLIASSVNDTLLCDSCSWKSFCWQSPVTNYVEADSVIPILPQNFRCQAHLGMFKHIFTLLQKQDTKEQMMSWIQPAKT